MNSFGQLFRVHIYGESHGHSVGIIIDGCPPGLALSVDDFMTDLNRRKAGAKGTTPRIEEDSPKLLNGIFRGYTTGAPIHISFDNTNIRSQDYSNLVEIPRPGHADYVANKKYQGYNDHRGGGHFSGRLTLCLVAAGVIAKRILNNIVIEAKLIEAGGHKDIEQAIDNALQLGDSIGGIIECKAYNIPLGLGEPFFDSLESKIAHLAFAIPAIKGIEFGSGFSSAAMYGSQHNDAILPDGKTKTNNAGGINGGISNGNELVFRIAVKPTSSISIPQQTLNLVTGLVDELKVKGRHDACIALRVPVVAEAITALALVDLSLIDAGINRKLE